ncbi:pheromone A receptor-domain-containing protein [Russula aff. rugulosa BPL654]|nr:pheromone A receptor-domain-containing protein [Russula aff. rugulosa BPL654]
MSPPPNEVYTAFSFIGFVLCAIPFYWHLEAWNTGTCLYMIWVGLGCLMQCINSIVWNKNMINRAPVYCDISTHIQVGLNVAIPACSLCINRRLYKIATMKTLVFSSSEKRRAVVYDLLIGVGIPILQMISEYVVSANRYDIFEDFGPDMSMVLTPLTFVLFSAWPVAIGTVSLFYCTTNIYIFYKRECQFRQLMASTHGLSHSRYIRLMVVSVAEILGTLPLGTYYIVRSSKSGVTPWRGWTYTHEGYSAVYQIPASIWKNNSESVFNLEMYRWSLVLCAFLFFALFGFAEEARRHYRQMYASVVSRIGFATSALHGSSHESNGGITVTVVKTGGEKQDSSISLTDRSSVLSISIANNNKNPDFKVGQHSLSNTVTSSSVESFHESKTQDLSTLPAVPVVIIPTAPPATVPPHFPETTRSTLRAYSSYDVV